MNRIGLPFDIAVPALQAWARKNQPRDGKEVISDAEVAEQVTSAFRKAYRGFGCDEPTTKAFCSCECPLWGRNCPRSGDPAQAAGPGAG
jgi:hypothetical protein